jgi:hypothetical protein
MRLRLPQSGQSLMVLHPRLAHQECGGVDARRCDRRFSIPPLASSYRTTYVLNLFAGPHSGKSTAAHGVTYLLKMFGADAEMAPEFVKVTPSADAPPPGAGLS